MPGSFTFLQVSSFQTRKGQHITLNAFKLLLATKPAVECRLVLAGNGPEFEAVRSLARSLRIEEHVDFTGWVSPAQARALMDEADCFVHHSLTVDGWTEGIPNAIIEAMAMELPVISTRHAGIPELVRDGVDGFLVEEDDVQAYAQRMTEVLSWGYLSESRRRVEELFEFERHMDQLREFYANVLKRDHEVRNHEDADSRR
jgi:colanic acid/amylovoran biosynthesis glycosyltransferase